MEDLVYLQMMGSRNKEKERKINQLLEDDRKKVLELAIPDPDEEMKVLELKDVVSDMKGVCQMLMEDRFEAITLWDGVEDLEKGL